MFHQYLRLPENLIKEQRFQHIYGHEGGKKNNIDNPEALEKLFQTDERGFATAFEEIYTDIEETELIRFWKIRLEHEKPIFSSRKLFLADIIKMIVACLVTGFLIKMPTIFNFPEELFYFRNTGLIVFGGLILYVTLSRRGITIKRFLYHVYHGNYGYLLLHTPRHERVRHLKPYLYSSTNSYVGIFWVGLH